MERRIKTHNPPETFEVFGNTEDDPRIRPVRIKAHHVSEAATIARNRGIRVAAIVHPR